MTTAARVRRAREGSEKQFSQQVCDLATLNGWKVQRFWFSVHSPAGWPDLFMVRGPRAIAAELKMGTRQPTPAQQDWLDRLNGLSSVTVCVWHPTDWDDIQRILARPLDGGARAFAAEVAAMLD